MAALPVGTLTFVLTDLESSTRAWEEHTAAMRLAMVQHDAIVYAAVQRNSGTTVESGREGDSILAVFVGSKDAAACALEIQRGFNAAAWPGGLTLRTRIAVHTCDVELRGGHYFGPALNRCARVLALGHGGQTLVTQATRELLAEDLPPEAELTDLGVHKLKDLRRSERIYQLTDLTRPTRFPPLNARSAYRSNIPILLTSFVGRERELRDLRGLLDRARLLTLTGTGGSGKTRLAKELALAKAASVSGGAWFVDLAPVSDPKLVARTTASALDIEEQQGRALIDTLAERLRDRATLLVLDNCEHLLDACAELAETLLARCPELLIVATSREPLNIGGEVTWRVPSLADDEAARLFVERARSRSPQLGVLDPGVVRSICQHLDGGPLAIELAAARTATMSADEILRHLDSGLALLAGGARTAAKRQQTLEATIDWSYQLLSDAERALLRRLSVFAASFSLDAAEAVCETRALPRAAIMEHLGQLVMKSLVQPADDRYGLLETIRAFARAKLVAAGERDDVERRHATCYGELASSRRPGELASWLDRIEDDHDDLRAAIEWSIAADPEGGAGIAAGLYEYWLLRGYHREARTSLDRLAARLLPSSPSRPRVLLESGVFAYTAGDFAAAPALIDAGIAGARSIRDRETLARGLVLQGGVALAAGEVDRAQAALDEGIAMARDLGAGHIEAIALHHLGSLASIRGDAKTARRFYTDSLERRRQLGTADEAGTTLTLRAFVEILAGDLVAARADITAALRAALSLRDRRAAWSLDVLSCLVAMGGSAEQALRLAGAAQALFESTAQAPPVMWRRFVEPLMQKARAQIGASASEEAWQSGRSLSFEQALHHALDV